MKPKELSRKSPAHKSFSVSQHILPRFLNIWHYHEEYELVYIHKSAGTKFIGDSISKFEPGDLVLIGSKLPHLWLNNEECSVRSNLIAEAWVIHFHPSCLGKDFFYLPEMKKIQNMLTQARVGLEILGEVKSKIIKTLSFLIDINSDEYDKIVKFLNILKLITDTPDKKKLSSLSFIDSHANLSGSRLDTVYEYVFNNFKDEISLDQIASLANMNSTSFSRYFKQTTNKTFTTFLNEVRIGFACRLIVEHGEMDIAEIGFESGYNNLSNFNKQFKKITDKTPSEYYRSYSTSES
ncbi:MAG: AraC family transcriptional regulator [Bacteroidetes bacterium]|nr:AraC family transcriptional regulator [Bacteroidota bacterium]MDA1119298.1 AraC family transcriptional regulator [Bacteroidota bacterium]